MIIFGADYENQNEDNKESDSQVNLNCDNTSNRPNFENEPNKKHYNLMRKFLNNVKTFIDNVKNKQEDSLEYLYSFCKL